MTKILRVSTMVLLTCTFQLSTAFGQSPNGMSYQAVIRNSSGQLITNQQVGMQISILQGSASGTAVYVETQSPTANANGLVTLEIGTGTTTDDFSAIDWANGPYFIKTETDPTGGTTYTITGTSQLLSVPYALYAKMAESISGTITETDPVFGASIAAGITGTDTTNWNNKLDSYTETDPIYNVSVAKGITATDTTNWNNKLDSYTETDPIFSTSVAAGIAEADTTNWNNKQNQLTAGTGISISGDTISTTGHYLGQEKDSGIIFYIYIGDDGQQHGLIVSKTETTEAWQSTISTTNANRSWDGVYNMGLMTNSPAKTWVTSNFSSEWYLPSIDELNLLWHARFHVNKALNDGGSTLLSNTANYWSSLEYDASNALSIYFVSGSGYGSDKMNTYKVRALRAF